MSDLATALARAQQSLDRLDELRANRPKTDIRALLDETRSLLDSVGSGGPASQNGSVPHNGMVADDDEIHQRLENVRRIAADLQSGRY